jgi:hypothetical protein
MILSEEEKEYDDNCCFVPIVVFIFKYTCLYELLKALQYVGLLHTHAVMCVLTQTFSNLCNKTEKIIN